MGRTVTLGTAVALAVAPLPAAGTAAADTLQHNITYRTRIDGLARGALVTYRISDEQVKTADPTMLPGRTFETTAVLTDPKEAGMRISIEWPYSANLHCEILVDDQLVVAADQFISPRITPARNDPNYGVMTCGAPLGNAYGSAPSPAAADLPAGPNLPGPPVVVPAGDLGAPVG